MMRVDNDKTIHITKGDRIVIPIVRKDKKVWNKDDVLKFSIVKAKNYGDVYFQKEFVIPFDTETFLLELSENDTKNITDQVISSPLILYYELEYNGNQTIIGYDDKGPKIFMLYPEASDKE